MASTHPAAFFTDHANLLAIFDDSARPDSCTKPNRQRLDRWALNMRMLWYEIFHICGEDNHLSDLGSRWGNRFLGGVNPVAKKGLRLGPALVARTLNGSRKGRGCRKCALRLDPPKVSTKVVSPDLDADKKFTLPRLADMVNVNYLARVQRKHAKSRPSHYKRVRGLWRNKEGEAWVPDECKDLQHLLYAVAHQGVSGHRGREVTLQHLLRGRVRWTNMREDVERWRKCCLQCIKNAKGDTVPRPLGTQLVPERAGKILMLDYAKIGPSNAGYEYVLVFCDKFSKLVELIPATLATAMPASKGIFEWGSRHGLPCWIISDGIRRFANHTLRLVAEHMGLQHHITLAYCPWSNGAIEVVGQDMIYTIRAILSGFEMPIEEWDEVIPFIQYVIS